MAMLLEQDSFEGRVWDLIVSIPDHCLSFSSEMTAISIMAMFLKEESKTTWNGRHTYYGLVS